MDNEGIHISPGALLLIKIADSSEWSGCVVNQWPPPLTQIVFSCLRVCVFRPLSYHHRLALHAKSRLFISRDHLLLISVLIKTVSVQVRAVSRVIDMEPATMADHTQKICR